MSPETLELPAIPTGYPLNATNVDWKVVGYVPLAPVAAGPTHHVNQIQQYLDPAKPDPQVGGWWPDPLLHLPWVAITSSAHAQPLWITVSGPTAAGHAGDYSGSLTINTDSGLPTQVAFSVKVHDFQIPPGAANNQHVFNFYRAGNPFVFNPGEYKLYGEFLLAHRMNPTEGIYDDPTNPAVVSSNEKLEELQHFHALGMSRFSVRNVTGYAFGPGTAAHRTIRGRLRQFFNDLGALPSGAAIRQKAMFYAYDEKNHEQCNINACPCTAGIRN